MTNDVNLIRQLETLIRDIVQQEIRKASFDRRQVATVTAVNGNLLNVEFADDGVEVTDIPNKTGETVIAGNQVYILKINNSNTNLVARIKKT